VTLPGVPAPPQPCWPSSRSAQPCPAGAHRQRCRRRRRSARAGQGSGSTRQPRSRLVGRGRPDKEVGHADAAATGVLVAGSETRFASVERSSESTPPSRRFSFGPQTLHRLAGMVPPSPADGSPVASASDRASDTGDVPGAAGGYPGAAGEGALPRGRVRAAGLLAQGIGSSCTQKRIVSASPPLGPAPWPMVCHVRRRHPIPHGSRDQMLPPISIEAKAAFPSHVC